jgi:hypothetical protein
MKMTINAAMMKDMFVNWNRDYYSYSGCEALIDFYDEIDENMEFDVIGICCECSEYGDDVTLSFNDLISDYGYKYPFEEWKENTDIDGMTEEEQKEEYIEALIETLEDYTSVLYVSNGNYIVFTF